MYPCIHIQQLNKITNSRTQAFLPHKMEHIAYRSIYLTISSSPSLTKAIAFLSKVTQITYPDKSTNGKQKKFKCWLCNRIYEHIFMLIVHMEILHVNIVDKYVFKNQAVFVVLRDRYKDRQSENVIANGFVIGLVKNNKPNQGYVNMISKTHAFVNNNPAQLRHKFQSRNKSIINAIIAKFEKSTVKKQKIYFHSTNIFKRINMEQDGQDSEQEIGEVQKQLQKLRIEDFSDVNDNDKRFFIEWNGFIHEKRKKLSIIYAHDMPTLFTEFASIAEKKGIPRINLVMHAWTLWSAGQITSNDVIKGLNQFDDSSSSTNNNAAKNRNEMEAQR